MALFKRVHGCLVNAENPESDWVADVVYELEMIMGATTSDANAVIGTTRGRDSIMRAWAKKLNPKQAAKEIEQATRR